MLSPHVLRDHLAAPFSSPLTHCQCLYTYTSASLKQKTILTSRTQPAARLFKFHAHTHTPLPTHHQPSSRKHTGPPTPQPHGARWSFLEDSGGGGGHVAKIPNRLPAHQGLPLSSCDLSHNLDNRAPKPEFPNPYNEDNSVDLYYRVSRTF